MEITAYGIFISKSGWRFVSFEARAKLFDIQLAYANAISHKIMIHLPQTGLQVFGSKLQLSNLQTTAPTDKTFEYRSFGSI